jgi:hypothetical protein
MKQSQIISNDAQAVNFREIRMGSIAPENCIAVATPLKTTSRKKPFHCWRQKTASLPFSI